MHMEQNISSHLAMTTATTIKTMTIVQNLQLKLEEKDAQIKAVKERLEKLETLPTGIAPPYYINFINCKK